MVKRDAKLPPHAERQSDEHGEPINLNASQTASRRRHVEPNSLKARRGQSHWLEGLAAAELSVYGIRV
jgi:hypothetical protein